MLGQIRAEFIFGLILFIMIIVFIVSQTNVLFSSLITDSKADRLKAKAGPQCNRLRIARGKNS